MQLVKQTKTQVIAYVKEHGTWHGVVCPCKMYPVYGITSYPLNLAWDDTYGVTVENETMLDLDSEEYRRIPRSLDHFLNNWSYYNTSSEEGTYAHYYRIVK